MMSTPISDFNGGSCSLKCLKVLTYKFLPYVIKIWGLIEKDSLAVLFPVFLAAVILVCNSWVEIVQLKKTHSDKCITHVSYHVEEFDNTARYHNHQDEGSSMKWLSLI